MKPMLPKIVTDWQKAMATPIPQCCHTCEHYTEDGKCREFDMMTPPLEFAQELNQCEKWLDPIPF